MKVSSRPGGHTAKKGKFTEERITYALRKAELDTPVAEVFPKLRNGNTTLYNWQMKYGGLSPSKLRG
ncbi:hypothetical protein KEC55_30620 [Burkholderia cepacia]|nr:hypothetical protein KEC55_30620 [Burkholderia cepacia]